MWTTGTASGHLDLLARLHSFLTATGSAFGLTYTGAGNGTFTAYRGGASSIDETFTITATSSSSFTVVGSVSGSIGPATVGTPFIHAKIAFLISAGGTAFESGDVFAISTAPAWTALQYALGARVTAAQGNVGATAAQNLVDGKSTSSSDRIWRVDAPVTIPQDVVFDFQSAETIASYELAAMSTLWGYAPSAWTFDYWDGDAWQTLDTQTAQGFGETEVKVYPITLPVSATRYRLHITAIPYSSVVMLGSVALRRTSGVDAAFGQAIWEAPGNDGDSEIFLGMHPFERQDADYFDLELCAFDGYNADAGFYGQAGYHGKLFLPLWNGSIPYYFVANGRSVKVIAKVGAQYECALLGFLDPYFSPEQSPYPMVLGGSLALGATLPTWESTRFRFSNSSNEHRAFTHADTQSVTPPNLTAFDSQLRARNLDGTWSPYEATQLDSATSPPPSYKHLILPYRCGLSLLDSNLDGSYSLFPVMLCHAAPNTIGELPGIACVTGQGLSAEALVRIGALDWFVIPNITRTDRDDFFAMRMD